MPYSSSVQCHYPCATAGLYALEPEYAAEVDRQVLVKKLGATWVVVRELQFRETLFVKPQLDSIGVTELQLHM